MPKNTIILIILFLFTNNLRSQQNTDSLLFDLEKQIFVSSNDTSSAYLISQKINIYLKLGKFDSLLLNEIERMNYHLLKDTLKISNFLWNASLMNYFNKKYDSALSYFNQYQYFAKQDTSLQAQLLNALILMNSKKVQLNRKLTELSLKDSLFSDIQCFRDVVEYEKKGEVLYGLSSAIIPGSGMIALGKPRQGITSLILNSASAFAVYSLAKSNLYFNSVTWGLLLAQKFYGGGIKLTDKLFIEKQEKRRYQLSLDCQEKIKVLLKKYPIKVK